MTKNVTCLSIVAISVTTVFLSGCGGGGGSSTSSNNNSLIPTTLTLDIKSVDGAKNIAATVFDFFAATNINSTNADFSNAPASSTNTTNCTPSGTSIFTVVNPDGIASVGDSFSTVSNSCASKTTWGTLVTTETSTLAISALSGNLASPTGTSSITLTNNAQSNISADETYNTVRYVSTAAAKLSSVTTSTHDGKSTVAITDDVDSTVVDSTFSVSGLTNSVPTSFSGAASNACSKVGSGNTICSKTEGTFAGNSFSLGSFNLAVKSTVPLQYNASGEPVAGSLSLTQGTDVATLTFSTLNSASQATIKTASGATQTFKYSDFQKITDTLF